MVTTETLIRAQTRGFLLPLKDQSLYRERRSVLWNSFHLLFDFDKLHFTELMFQGKDKAPVSLVTAKNMKVVLFFGVKVMFPGAFLPFLSATLH